MSSFDYTAPHWRSSAVAAAEGPAPTARGVARGIVTHIVTRLRAILRGMRGGHDSQLAVRQLQSLSDWQLKDIGLHRSQIWYRAGGISAYSTRSGHAED